MNNNFKSNIKSFRNKLYSYLFLDNFRKKNTIQQITSILYNLVFAIISLVGLVPIIAAFDSSNKFNYDIYFLSLFVLSFFFLIDLIFRMFVLQLIHKKETYRSALKSQLLSLSGYIQFISWVIPFVITLSNGDFNGILGINIKEDSMFAFLNVATSVLFLLNLIFCVGRFISLSNSNIDLDIFKKVLISKLKLILISTISVFAVAIIFGYILYSIENPVTHPNPDTKFKTIFDAIYFAIVTITTVGFGDIVATKVTSRTVVILLIIIGIFIYSFLTSQFIDIFNEYYKRKKMISIEASSNKRQELNNKYLISEIDKLILKNMYEAGVISKVKYNKLMKVKNEEKNYYEFNSNDFELDDKNGKIINILKELGNQITDWDQIQIAEEKEWAIDYQSKNMNNVETALYFLTMKVANSLASSNNLSSIIFTRKTLPNSIKKLIIYQKKPYISTVGEVDVVCSIRVDTEEAWKKYSKFTDMSKAKFSSIFKNQKQVTIIFIKNIIEYSNPKPLVNYGVKDGVSLKDIIPLL